MVDIFAIFLPLAWGERRRQRVVLCFEPTLLVKAWSPPQRAAGPRELGWGFQLGWKRQAEVKLEGEVGQPDRLMDTGPCTRHKHSSEREREERNPDDGVSMNEWSRYTSDSGVGGKHYHSPLQQQHIHYLNRATVSGSHGSCVHSDQPALGPSLQKHLGTLVWLFNQVFPTMVKKKKTVQYTTEFGVKGAVNRTRQHLSPGGASERVQDSGSVGVPASNTPKNFSCWTDWNVMWILSSFYLTLSTVQKWKHARAIKSKHSHPARLTRCLLTEAKGLSGSHRKVCKSKETSNKHLTMLTEIQRREKKTVQGFQKLPHTHSSFLRVCC